MENVWHCVLGYLDFLKAFCFSTGTTLKIAVLSNFSDSAPIRPILCWYRIKLLNTAILLKGDHCLNDEAVLEE